METRVRGSLTARLWLTGVVFGQIILTPMIAFSITYLFNFQSVDGALTLSFEKEMIPWILSASLAYGMLALALALVVGGYTPISITEKGGWRASLGFSRVSRDSTTLRRVKQRHIDSPHGRLSTLVNDRIQEGHSIISIHGGLLLLAIPFQILLVTLPLLIVLTVPDSALQEGRRLELAMGCYVVILIVLMRAFSRFASKYVTIAAFTRRWLISMTRLSWLAPVLVLWLLGRLSSMIVITWLGNDLSTSLAMEQHLFEDLLGIGTVPKTSFLDLLTALAVMPMAAFTTLAVLGGSAERYPDWARRDNPNQPEEVEESEDEVEDFAAFNLTPEPKEPVPEFELDLGEEETESNHAMSLFD